MIWIGSIFTPGDSLGESYVQADKMGDVSRLLLGPMFVRMRLRKRVSVF